MDEGCRSGAGLHRGVDGVGRSGIGGLIGRWGGGVLQGCAEVEHEQLLERGTCEAANGHETADRLQCAASATAGRFVGVGGARARGPAEFERASHAVNEHKWGNAGWAEPWIVPSEGRLGRYGLTSSFKHGYSWFEWQASPIRKPSGSKCVEKDCWSGDYGTGEELFTTCVCLVHGVIADVVEGCTRWLAVLVDMMLAMGSVHCVVVFGSRSWS